MHVHRKQSLCTVIGISHILSIRLFRWLYPILHWNFGFKCYTVPWINVNWAKNNKNNSLLVEIMSPMNSHITESLLLKQLTVCVSQTSVAKYMTTALWYWNVSIVQWLDDPRLVEVCFLMIVNPAVCVLTRMCARTHTHTHTHTRMDTHGVRHAQTHMHLYL